MTGCGNSKSLAKVGLVITTSLKQTFARLTFALLLALLLAACSPAAAPATSLFYTKNFGNFGS